MLAENQTIYNLIAMFFLVVLQFNLISLFQANIFEKFRYMNNSDEHKHSTDSGE